MKTDREERLDTLRDEARRNGAVNGRGVDVAGGPIPRKPGYYGEAVVRPPVWTWEIAAYFWIGGAAGMVPLIACAALLKHQAELAFAAMLLATVGALVSPVLLILDLGRPLMFYNMLRVFKWRSPMSVGSWILSLFSPCAVGGFIMLALQRYGWVAGGIETVVHALGILLVIGAAFWGLGLATYTAVLIGATVVPAWYLHRVKLPIHFGIAGLGTAAAILEIFGHRLPALNIIGLIAAGIETILLLWLEIDKHGKADRALHTGVSGWMLRISEFMTGPLSLGLRLYGGVFASALTFAVGAAINRFGWIEAGRASGKDPESVFAAQGGYHGQSSREGPFVAKPAR